MLIPFIGYAADCTIWGELTLQADRLKDQLERDRSIIVHRAAMEALADASSICVPRLTLALEDLLAVETSMPRGIEGRRIHTVRHSLAAVVGPYRVHGLLHERPGAPPMSLVSSAHPVVSFTEAWITFDAGGVFVRRFVETLLVNASRMEWAGQAAALPRAEPRGLGSATPVA